MNKYIALLRGINVSGQKKIKMADLTNHCLSIGFEEVVTYIQSGNIIFSSSNIAPKELAKLLQDKIMSEYGFDVPVLVISKPIFIEVFNNLPFSNINLENDGSKVLVSFLDHEPKQTAIDELLSYVCPPENLTVNKDLVYLHCPNGYGKSKLSNNFVENKLKVTATTRNLKTVCKLVDLLS